MPATDCRRHVCGLTLRCCSCLVAATLQDRITSCAEHSLVAKSDPALAAKLRLAIAAQLPAANLQQAAAASGTKAKGQSGLLQGLDAAGVAAYIDQLLEEFVAAVRQAGPTANGAAAEGEDSDDDGMPDADAGMVLGPGLPNVLHLSAFTFQPISHKPQLHVATVMHSSQQ